MPPLRNTRQHNNEPPLYVVVDHQFTVSQFLAQRLYDLETTLKADRTCAICLEECCCRKCATYLKCGHGPYHLQCVLSLPVKKCPVCRLE